MKIFVLLLLVSSLFYAEGHLGNYNCDTQNYDFWYEATILIKKDFEGDENEKKRVLGSYYQSTSGNCRVDNEKWCIAYKYFKKRDYKLYKSLWYFKCHKESKNGGILK